MGGLRDGKQEETRSGKIEFLISKQNYPQYASEPNKLTPTQQTQISLGPFPPPPPPPGKTNPTTLKCILL